MRRGSKVVHRIGEYLPRCFGQALQGGDARYDGGIERLVDVQECYLLRLPSQEVAPFGTSDRSQQSVSNQAAKYLQQKLSRHAAIARQLMARNWIVPRRVGYLHQRLNGVRHRSRNFHRYLPRQWPRGHLDRNPSNGVCRIR